MHKQVFQSEDLLRFLNKGDPVLFPTDTVPALAASINDAEKLWQIKNRPKTKPLILMGSSIEQLLSYALPEAYEDASKIASSYWPGAITIAIPALSEIVQILNPTGNSIGIRVPACTLTLELLKKSGPLATTSANFSGLDPSLDADGVAKCFPELPLLGPIPWPQSSGLASTLIKWNAPGSWLLLRRGAVIPAEVLKG